MRSLTDTAQIQKEILIGAAWIYRHPEQGHGKEGWFKPMHVGGKDASSHSGILRRMVRHGLMEKRWWGRAYAYRITPEGIAKEKGLSQ